MFKKICLFCVFLFLANFCVQANINNLRGTLSILKPEFYQYSVIHGAVAWEKDWVMNIWDLGWERKKANIEAGEKRDELINSKDAPALVNVVDRLFHRPPNTAGTMNFTPTAAVKNKKPEDVAKVVANIFGFTFSKDFQKLLQVANDVNAFLISLQNPETINAAPEKYKSVLTQMTQLTNFTQLFSFYKTQLKSLKVANLKKEFELLAKFKFQLESLVKGTDRIVNKQFSTNASQISAYPLSLVMALLENWHETQMVLLALVWYCCKSDKSALGEYYKALQAGNPESSIFVNDVEPDWGVWSSETFILERLPEMREYMDKIVAENKVKEFFDKDSSFDEVFVYLQLAPGKYPKISAYKTATLWIDGKKVEAFDPVEKKKGFVTFPNCMDCAMMNAVLVFAYDPKNIVFDLDYLKSKKSEVESGEEGEVVDSAGKEEVSFNFDFKLVDFFQSKHPAFERIIKNEKTRVFLAPNSIEDIEVHNAWTDVISNIPGVAYHKKIDKEVIVEALHTDKGFMVVKDKDMSEKLKEAGYFPVENNVCYELKPTLKNFIVVLNHLFGLNLYQSNDVYTEILKPDFIKTYLPQIGKRLGVVFDLSISIDDIDECDFGKEIITSLVFEKENPAPFKLSTSHVHGELQKQPIQSDVSAISAQLPYFLDKFPSLRGIKLMGLDDDAIESESWMINNNVSWYDLYWFNKAFIEDLLENFATYSVKLDKLCERFFLRTAYSQPDLGLKLLLLSKMVSCLRGDSKSFEEIINIAKDGVKSISIHERYAAISLFNDLVKKDKGIAEALIALQSIGSTADNFLRMSIVRLFEALFEKGVGLKEVFDVIAAREEDLKSGLEYDDEFEQTLINAIIKKLGHLATNYENVLLITNFASDHTRWTKDIFKALFKRNKGFEQAIEVAKKCVARDDESGILQGFNIFKILINHGKAFNDAIVAMNSVYETYGDDYYNELIELQNALQAQGVVFQ